MAKPLFFTCCWGIYTYQGKIFALVQFDYFPYEVFHSKRPTKEILHEIYPLLEEWEFSSECSYLQIDVDQSR